MIVFLVAFSARVDSANAQGRVGSSGGSIKLPLPTTMWLEKVIADRKYDDNAKILSISIDGKTYYYVLKDIYVEDPAGFTMGIDVWRHVQSSRPMMTVRSRKGDALAGIEPGESVTVQGLFSFGSRTLRIADVQPGRGLWEPPKHY